MMLLDTHVVVWLALSPDRLSERALQTTSVGRQQRRLAISDISLWEIAMLINKKRIRVESDCGSFLNVLIEGQKIHVYPISPEIAAMTSKLPIILNNDPADRIIAATAIVEELTLVTADRNLRQVSELRTLW